MWSLTNVIFELMHHDSGEVYTGSDTVKCFYELMFGDIDGL